MFMAFQRRLPFDLAGEIAPRLSRAAQEYKSNYRPARTSERPSGCGAPHSSARHAGPVDGERAQVFDRLFRKICERAMARATQVTIVPTVITKVRAGQ
jgi:hypothetical protein